MIIDDMTREEIEESVTKTFHRVTCKFPETYTPSQWRRTRGRNLPQMCNDVAVECFRRDWMPVGSHIVREVLNRLDFNGDWVTPLNNQLRPVR